VLLNRDDCDLETAFVSVRKCRHPDAQLLTSLFPAGVDVTQERLLGMMQEQQNEARAFFRVGAWGPL
jgi:hypothetical protein